MISARMTKYNRESPTCKHLTKTGYDIKSDFSHYTSFDSYEKEPYFYCALCETRWYKNKIWNPDEWDEYVNDEKGAFNG